MRNVLIGALGVTAAALAPLATGDATAQDEELVGMTWASIAEDLPDWSGLWQPPLHPDHVEGGWELPQNGRPSLTEEYAGRLEEAREHRYEVGDSASCLPPGMPTVMRMPYPYEFIFEPGKVVIVGEAYMQIRYIYTDGRGHPDPDILNPTFNGHSIGHWEGDTLVVDTVGMKGYTALTAEISADDPFAPVRVEHSDEMTITERIRRVADNRMEIETTVTDPKALTEPWTTVTAYERHTDWDIDEFVCQENNPDY